MGSLTVSFHALMPPLRAYSIFISSSAQFNHLFSPFRLSAGSVLGTVGHTSESDRVWDKTETDTGQLSCRGGFSRTSQKLGQGAIQQAPPHCSQIHPEARLQTCEVSRGLTCLKRGAGEGGRNISSVSPTMSVHTAQKPLLRNSCLGYRSTKA